MSRLTAITPPPADVDFFVPGHPVTQGSHKIGKVGRQYRVVHEHADELEAWRATIETYAVQAWKGRDPIPNGHPAVLRLTFLVDKGSSLPKWRLLPTGGAGDLDKMVRAAADGLSYQTWVVQDGPRKGERRARGARIVCNDGQIVCLPPAVYFVGESEEPGVRVQVWAVDRDLERSGMVPAAVWTYVPRSVAMTLGGIA